jgi:acetate---CoA ligase (ADP-forming)
MTVTERRLYRMGDLASLLDPATIAVVGASTKVGSFGQRTLANLGRFQGRVYGINPKYREVEGFPCLPRLADLPDAPDCVVLCVPRPLVETALADAIAVGARSAIIYASGYAETAQDDRIAAQNRLSDLARGAGIRVAGPNCVGLANMRSGAAMNFMADCNQMLTGEAGRIAVVSQSGALGYSLLQGRSRGIGISHYLTSGNSADIDVADYIASLADDPDVRAIACVFEGVKDGGRFLQAASLVRDARKALIVYKTGNTATSSKTALSHTGTLVGSVAAYRAAFEAGGAVQADDLGSVLELAATFAKAGVPRAGRGVGILATSGGAGVISADKAEEAGLILPDLVAATRRALGAVVPEFGSVANPSDLTAEVLKSSTAFTHCLQAFADDPGFSAVVVPFVFAHPLSSGARAPVLCEVAAETNCVIAAIWMSEWLEGPGSALLDADPNVLMFRSAERGFSALAAWSDWHERRTVLETHTRRSRPCAAEEARRMIAAAPGKVLSETDSKRLLAAYGIAVPAEDLAETPTLAAEVAKRLGFPVAVKIASADIPHKTEVGGIRLDLQDENAVTRAAEDVLAAARQRRPDARLQGVNVQTMVPPGTELVLGIKRDAQFGPLLVIGLGGLMVELLRDVATSLVPVPPRQAKRMLESLRGYKLLEGFRGRPACLLESVIDTICRFSELAADLADVIEEADVNPIIAGPAGTVAADALFVCL